MQCESDRNHDCKDAPRGRVLKLHAGCVDESGYSTLEPGDVIMLCSVAADKYRAMGEI